MAAYENSRPSQEIRLGRIKAAIWKNDTEHGARYSVSITRIYKAEERWESTTSFGRDDLPLVAKVADLAHSWIYQQNGDHREEAKPENGLATNGETAEPKKSRRKSAHVF